MEARTRVVFCVLAAALSACGESASKPAAHTTTPLTVAPAATVPATVPAISVALDCSGAVGVYNKMLVNYKEGAPMTRAQLDELAMRSFNACTSAVAWSDAATTYGLLTANGPNVLAITCARVDPHSTSTVCASLS
jgi:hypothetical protein